MAEHETPIPRMAPKPQMIDSGWLRDEFLKANPAYSDKTIETLIGDFSRFLECLLIRWDGTGFEDIMESVGFKPDSKARIQHLRDVVVARRAGDSQPESFEELVETDPISAAAMHYERFNPYADVTRQTSTVDGDVITLRDRDGDVIAVYRAFNGSLLIEPHGGNQ